MQYLVVLQIVEQCRGNTSGEADMNTAVLRTRWEDAAADLIKTGSSMLLSSNRTRIRRRPIDQVVSTVNNTAATASENQPPSGILVTFEVK